MIIKIENYMFDLDKFQLSLNSGQIYKTDKTGVEIKIQAGFYKFKFSMDYPITKDFIVNNFEKLSSLNIVKKRGMCNGKF
ncbi:MULTISPECIES: hypothetical protein [unclassified Fusobacterium]|uniref:hypothetical protein n=1 Tax=unclassified Fusobacterium TaxID=2648384 RepID=UPI001B8D1BCE|nr:MULTISPECIES: hypothetical protein [unclassified Fusobacterium]MBR8700499.1 hypothetical protein [Fusobacterium sp. DD45]MBR8710236.1 hypothetical protein [Fusobacterium sp. DD28]MBR8750758.1 hypothetical protein [Fusobacterium sp. DD26]